MKKLLKGIVDFRQHSLTNYREKFAKLVAGQSPDALMIACCDSRVAPNVFASSDPGDLFVLRNIGNLVPPYHQDDHLADNSVAAAIEFSLLDLKVSDIVICGHSECAAICSIYEHKTYPQHEFLNSWLEHAAPAAENHYYSSKKNLKPHNLLSQANVLQQITHLKTYPCVATALQQNRLRLHGWWFDLATADVYHYDESVKDFVVIDKQEAEKIIVSL